MDQDFVVLVDKNDQELGLAEKLSAHQRGGQLHRAVSVLAFRKKSGVVEVLLQKRAGSKPLWPGCWTNTICTHPKQMESPEDCAIRRLDEEMGIKMTKTKLAKIADFYYRSEYSSDLTEHEFDHVYICEYNGPVKLNRTEVQDSRWIPWHHVLHEVHENPDRYTGWFRLMAEDSRLADAMDQL
jgi:isopentenyl-diphosphate Delta-isomerase